MAIRGEIISGAELITQGFHVTLPEKRSAKIDFYSHS